MNLNKLNIMFSNLEDKYDKFKNQKNIYSLSKKENQMDFDSINNLIEEYKYIYSEVYELFDSLLGEHRKSAQNLYDNCNIYINHLNSKLSNVTNIINQKNNLSAIRRDIFIMIGSIIFSLALTIYLPSVHELFGQNQNVKLENKLENISEILTQNLETNKKVEQNIKNLDPILSKFDLNGVNINLSQILKSNNKIKKNLDSLVSFTSKLDSTL